MAFFSVLRHTLAVVLGAFRLLTGFVGVLRPSLAFLGVFGSRHGCFPAFYGVHRLDIFQRSSAIVLGDFQRYEALLAFFAVLRRLSAFCGVLRRSTAFYGVLWKSFSVVFGVLRRCAVD